MKCNPKTFIHSFFAKEMSRHNALARSGAVDSFHNIVNIKAKYILVTKCDECVQLLSLYAVEFNTGHKIDQLVAMTKISLSQELGSISWDAISGDDVEKQVKILDSTITKVYDKHCPVRNARVPVGMPCFTAPQITKLSRAEQGAHK